MSFIKTNHTGVETHAGTTAAKLPLDFDVPYDTGCWMRIQILFCFIFHWQPRKWIFPTPVEIRGGNIDPKYQ